MGFQQSDHGRWLNTQLALYLASYYLANAIALGRLGCAPRPRYDWSRRRSPFGGEPMRILSALE